MPLTAHRAGRESGRGTGTGTGEEQSKKGVQQSRRDGMSAEMRVVGSVRKTAVGMSETMISCRVLLERSVIAGTAETAVENGTDEMSVKNASIVGMSKTLEMPVQQRRENAQDENHWSTERETGIGKEKGRGKEREKGLKCIERRKR